MCWVGFENSISFLLDFGKDLTRFCRGIVRDWNRLESRVLTAGVSSTWHSTEWQNHITGWSERKLVWSILVVTGGQKTQSDASKSVFNDECMAFIIRESEHSEQKSVDIFTMHREASSLRYIRRSC